MKANFSRSIRLCARYTLLACAFLTLSCDPSGPVSGGPCEYEEVDHTIRHTETGVEVVDQPSLESSFLTKTGGAGWYKESMFKGDISDYLSPSELSEMEASPIGTECLARFSVMTTGSCTPVLVFILPERPADP